MRGASKAVLILTAAVLLPSLAFAQGTLTGTVRDQSGGVLPGVTVEASSPALIEKVRTAVTDGAGQYRITGLNPGTYSLTFTLPGFNVVKREGIELSGTATLTIPVDMRVGALEETITVTGETPVVDVQSTQRETVLSADVVAAIPGNRSVGTLLNAVPGLTRQRRRARRVADDDLLRGARRPDQRRAHGDQRHDDRGAVQRRRRVDLHPRFGQRRRGLGGRRRRPRRVGHRRAGDEPRAAFRRQPVPRPGVHQQRGRLVARQQPERRAARAVGPISRKRPASSTPTTRASRTAARSSAIDSGSLAAIAAWRRRRRCQGVVANANAFNASRWDWVADPSVTARTLQGRASYIGRITAQVSAKHRVSFNQEYQRRCEGSPLKLDSDDGCNTRGADWVAAGSGATRCRPRPIRTTSATCRIT